MERGGTAEAAMLAQVGCDCGQGSPYVSLCPPFAIAINQKTAIRKPKFIEIETLEKKVERLAKSYAPNATPSGVNLFRPLLTRLAILEEQNVSDSSGSYLSNGF